jgi:hypothetical protein
MIDPQPETVTHREGASVTLPSEEAKEAPAPGINYDTLDYDAMVEELDVPMDPGELKSIYADAHRVFHAFGGPAMEASEDVDAIGNHPGPGVAKVEILAK